MLFRRKLKEDYSIIDPTANYKGIWFRTIPKNPRELFKFYLGVENIKTGKRRIKSPKICYFGKNIPYFELNKLEFNEKGLLAKVRQITDITGNNKSLYHLLKNLILVDKEILIPRRKFPK